MAGQRSSEAPIWYLGYGSMCNQTSLRRRGVLPSKSLPVTVEGWELEFSWNGMANVFQQPGSVLHGIAHLVTPKMFEVLARIEAVYDVEEVAARPYDGAEPPVTARIFTIPHTRVAASRDHAAERGEEDHLPSERYIRIICEGLRHYGADPAWVARVAAHPAVPARPRHGWLRAPPAADAQLDFTAAQLEEHRGRLPSVYAIGQKVLRADLTDAAHPFADILKMISGQKACSMFVMNLYDPSLPPVEGPDDLLEVHLDWAEDEAMGGAVKYGYKVEVIGRLVEEGAATARAGDPGAAAGGAAAPSASGAGKPDLPRES